MLRVGVRQKDSDTCIEGKPARDRVSANILSRVFPHMAHLQIPGSASYPRFSELPVQHGNSKPGEVVLPQTRCFRSKSYNDRRAIISHNDIVAARVAKLKEVIMLQAEIAGRLVPPHEGWPRKGDVIRDFQLMSSEEHPVLLSENRGRFNMVLVFAGESDSANSLLCELALHQPELAGNEARTLAIVVGSQARASELRRSLHLSFEVLADENERVHRSMGTEDESGNILPAVFITDRFGEIFAAFRAAQSKGLPGIAAILSWIDFINRQCPECGPLEWPD